MHALTFIRPATLTLALAGLTLSAHSANAALVAADSFLDGGSAPDTAAGQYQTDGFGGLGTTIRTQDPTVLGFVNPWGGTSNTGIGWYSTGNILTRATGLDLGYGFEQPGSIGYLNTPNDFLVRFIQRELDTPSIDPTSTWYMSAIVNPGGDLGDGRQGFLYAGFTNDLTDGRLYRDPDDDPGNIGNLFGAVVGFEKDSANNEMDLVLRHRQDIGGSIEPASNVLIDGVVDQTSYAVFLKIDAVAGGVDSIKYWVNPAGVSEAEWDVTNDASGTLSSYGFNSDAGSWNALDLDMNRAVIATGNWNGSMSVDELRLATTFEDLLGLSAELDGDLNSDGFVGLDDLDIILNNWNQNVVPGDLLSGDPSNDGFVGLDDLDIILNNWNAGTPPTAGIVPEPTTLALAGLSAMALLRRRK